MILHYLKIAWRNMLKYSLSTNVILTIFSQVYRASNQNPAEVVKLE